MRRVSEEAAVEHGELAVVQPRGRRERPPLFAWLMVLPTVTILLAVTVFPLVYSLRISFTSLELTISERARWVGIDNYVRALTDDPRFWPSLGRTLYLVALGVGIELVLGLGLALLLQRIGRGRTVATALLLVPVMMAPVVVATEAVVIFNNQWGPLNYLIRELGLQAPVWLGDADVALQSILLVDVWQWTPFVAIILLSGLSALPPDLYEAAAIDGAGRWQTFRHLTLVLLQPLIIVIVLLRTMDIFKLFDTVYVLTGGGPGTATETISYYTFLQGLQFFSLGYAAALSFLQLILISVIAAVLIRRMRKGLG